MSLHTRHTRSLILFFAVLALGVLGGIIFHSIVPHQSLQPMQWVENNALYIRDYESIDDMMDQEGNVIIRGTVTARVTRLSLGENVPFTDTVVRVAAVFRGELNQPGATHVTVRQTGKVENNRGFVLEGQKLLTSGEDVVLVLTPGNVSGLYHIVGGIHGYFLLENGHIKNARLHESGHHFSAKHDQGKHPLSEFAKRVDTSNLSAAFGGANASPREND